MSSKAVATLALAAGAFVGVGAATLSLDERVAAGECAGTAVERESFFDSAIQLTDLPSSSVAQAEDLSDLNSLGYTRSAVELLIDYGANFKVLTDEISKEQYILTQCGTDAPSDDEVDAVKARPDSSYSRKSFTIPVQSVVATGTTQLAFIQALGLEDRVHKVTGYAVGACWQKGANECEAELEAPGSWGGNATLRANQLDAAELVLAECSSYQPVECSSVNALNNGVHFASTTSSAGNLHAAEYIKWLAAFFNKEEEAKSMFNDAMSLYVDAKSANGAGQKVAWVSYEAAGYWNAERFTLSLAIYKQELVTAAAGANIDGDAVHAEVGGIMTKFVDAAGNPSFQLETSHYNGSKADTAAALLEALSSQGVNVLIDETYQSDTASYTIDTFLSNFGLASTSLKVLRIDGTLSASNNLDWYESRVAHPHRAVQGLQRVMLPDSSLPKHFFRDISAGEVPDVILASACTTPLPFCDPTMIASVGEASAAGRAAAPLLVAALGALLAAARG
ncbi:unnamed protein product [Prorocentrum cordatum]|uniref:Phospholipase B-like n=1 Tax=Prorocentrum cordatum TaxID=2364126 RepID=A0ABN9WNG9_9DINO|nr:unnamed protein product [Polarella glacialis]